MGILRNESVNMTRKEIAINNFYEGYNCTQAVVLAFSDLIDMDTNQLLMMVSSLGGGMGRLREVCGSVSGMFLVLGTLEGYSDPNDNATKRQLYENVQLLAGEFEQKNGSIVCRELLGMQEKRQEPVPEERTEAYYKKRPCPELVGMAAEILQNYIENQEQKI